MLKIGTLLAFILLIFSSCFAEDVWVNGYTKKDGTYVDGYYRSSPNAYKWDNKSFSPSQPDYNESYYAPNKNYNSDWYQPSTTRYNDNNSYNDSPSMYKLPKMKSIYDLND